jgi:hypothetical protein
MTTTSFDFIPRAYRPPKPRSVGLTEIRGPYYSTYAPVTSPMCSTWPGSGLTV